MDNSNIEEIREMSDAPTLFLLFILMIVLGFNIAFSK